MVNNRKKNSNFERQNNSRIRNDDSLVNESDDDDDGEYVADEQQCNYDGVPSAQQEGYAQNSAEEFDEETGKKRTSNKRKRSSGASGRHSTGGSQTANSYKVVERTRFDSSLIVLTKKFLDVIQTAENGKVDLTSTATNLNVKKRRIYDITNVLEGAGLVEKTSKNFVQWKGSVGPFSLDPIGCNGGPSVSNIAENSIIGMNSNRYRALLAENAELEQKILSVQNNVRMLAEKRPFIRFKDIRNLPAFRDKIILAIRAPRGTELRVEDDGSEFPKKRFQIYMQSQVFPINVYSVSEDLKDTVGTKYEPMRYNSDYDFMMTKQEGITDLYNEENVIGEHGMSSSGGGGLLD